MSLSICAVILTCFLKKRINMFYGTNTLVFVLSQNDRMWYPVTGKNSSLHPTLCVSVSVPIQWTQISTNHNAQKLHGITKLLQMHSLTYTNDTHEIHFTLFWGTKYELSSNYEYIMYKPWCMLYQKCPTFFQPAPKSQCSNYTQLIHQVQCWWHETIMQRIM